MDVRSTVGHSVGFSFGVANVNVFLLVNKNVANIISECSEQLF